MISYTTRHSDHYALRLTQSVFFALLLAVFGFVGVKILYCLENLSYVLEHGLSFSGTSFYGAVFLVPVFMIPIGLAFHLRPSQTLDLCAANMTAMIGCMRIGCFLSGCCGGWCTTIFGWQFVWPTQAMESIGDFLIFSILANMDSEKRNSGKLYPFFMVGYGSLRFVIEFLRDTPKDILYLSRGQWYSLLAILLGITAITISNKMQMSVEVKK